jgi:hypothetical protein
MNSQNMTTIVIQEVNDIPNGEVILASQCSRPGRTKPLQSLDATDSRSFRKRVDTKPNTPNKTMLNRIKAALKPRRK